jgi:acetylglutamate kinase
MKFVVKLGGATLENTELLHKCAQAIAELVKDGNQVALVHGGGVQLTRTLKLMGKQSEFVAGLRVTDAETRDAAVMVLGGQVNKALVAALGAHGQAGMGLSGGDGLVFRARKKRTAPDLGYVGEIVASDPRWLDAIWKMGAVPVISSIALGFDGEYYNVNADEMAAACAAACKADALVFLTDVPGVRGADGEVMRWLSVGQIASLTRDSVISGNASKIERVPRGSAAGREARAHSSRGSGGGAAGSVQLAGAAWDRSFSCVKQSTGLRAQRSERQMIGIVSRVKGLAARY